MRISDWSSDVCSSDLSSFEPEALLAVCEQGLCSIIFQILFGYPYSAAWSNDSSSSIGAIATGIAPIRGWPKIGSKSAFASISREVHPPCPFGSRGSSGFGRSEEHTSELQSLMRISYAGFCLKNK